MAWTADELKTWVAGLGIPADEQAVVLASLGKPEVMARVSDQVLARSDYSRKMDELKTKETQAQQQLADAIKAEQQKTQSYATDVSGWKADKEKILNDAIAKREAAEAKLNAVQAKIREVAPTYGLDDSVLNPIFETTAPAARTEPPARDLDGKFVSREEIDALGKQWVKLPALMAVIQQEHAKLFPGQDLDAVKLMDEALANKRTLSQQWELTYKVPEKRSEIAQARHDADIKAAEERGAERAKSQFLVDNPGAHGQSFRRDVPGSPVLDAQRAREAAARAAGNAPVHNESGAEAAARSWNEGKYAKERAA